MQFAQTRAPAILAVLLFAMASPAFGDLWYENYQRGEDALRSKNWTEAIAQFTQALEKKGDPGVGVRTYGMNFINYHPYLKLGIAYLNLGQVDAALQAFDTEERLGAIARSPNELKDLAAFREQAKAAQASRQADVQKKVADLVRTSLEEARILEQKGELDGAMGAVGKALAVDKENAEAVSMMGRLKEMVAKQQSERDVQNRVAGLVKQARDLLAAGKFEEASSALNQALVLKPDNAEAKSYLAESQAKLLEQIQASRNIEARRTLVTDGLTESARLEKDGQFDQALKTLQSVLAVDPANREALMAQERLAKLQAEVEGERTRTQEVNRFLVEGEDQLKGGHLEASVAAFNRVLALDPQNSLALAGVGKVYNEISAQLRGSGTAVNLPPSVSLVDFTNEEIANKADQALRRQRVSSGDFILTGTAIDDQPVKLAYYNGQNLLHEDLLDKRFGNVYVNSFQWRYTLSPGASTLKVVVTDPGGLRSQAEYHVFYDVPLWKRWWFYLALGLIGAAVTGGYLGYRTRRRNLLLKRRFNPYVAGAPVLNDDMFVGREALLSRILQTIHNNSILLYGERRIGKTSLQHHLKKRLLQLKDPDYDFHPVYVDLQGTPQERFFGTLAEDIFDQLRTPLEAAELRRRETAGGDYDYSTFVRDTHDVLKALRKLSQKKVKLVLLIDEVDELNNYDPRINQRLRSLFMKSFAEDMVAVVSGVAIKKQWASEGSPWYNFFEEIELKPFTQKDARDLIERPIRGVFKLDAGAVDQIIENSGCKPYLIQKLCVALVNRMHDEKRSRITVSDVEAIGRPAEG